MRYEYAVFIGRMQPPHKKHIEVITDALNNLAQNVIIMLGSHGAAPDTRNPWSTEEREEMIRSCFSEKLQERLIFAKLRDYMYNDVAWFTQVQQIVDEIVDDGEQDHVLPIDQEVCVIGCKKDDTSWYLDLLPEQWNREFNVGFSNELHATEVRDLYFYDPLLATTPLFRAKVPESVCNLLVEWSYSETYKNLKDEWKHIKDYKEIWAQAPYPVTFVTTDVAVVKAGHVLVVRRKFNPGKGLLALPGGFVNQNEKIIDSAFRELKEETRILMPKAQLMNHIVDEKVFDHPGRSQRGRTITHAYCVSLPGAGLPKVRGSDDAERAIWLPIAELYIREKEFFEDHLHILRHFISKL